MIPLITRAYSPVEVGWYQLAMAASMTLQPLATLRTEFVVPATRYQATAATLMRRGAVSTSLCVAALTAGSGIAAVFAAGSTSAVLIMTALLVAGLAWTAIDNARLIRASHETVLAARNLTAGLMAAGLQVLVILTGMDVVFLAVSVLVGRAVAIVATLGRHRLSRLDVGREPNPYTVRRAWKSILSGIVATGTGQSFVFAAGVGFGAAGSAFVGVAQRAAGAPLTLLGQGLGQVMQSRVAPLIREGRPGVTRRLVKQILWLSIFASATAAVLIILAPTMAVPILGDGWAKAGQIAAILAFPFSLQLIAGPLMTVLPMMGREGLLLLIQIVRLLLVTVTVTVAVVVGATLLEATYAFGVATVAGYVGMLATVLAVARRFDVRHQKEPAPSVPDTDAARTRRTS